MKILSFLLLQLSYCWAIPANIYVGFIEYAASQDEMAFNNTMDFLADKLTTEQETHIRECYKLGLINNKDFKSGYCNNLLVPNTGAVNRSFAPPEMELSNNISAQLPNARQVVRHALALDPRAIGGVLTTDVDVMETEYSTENNLLLSGLLQLTTHHLTSTSRNTTDPRLPFISIFDHRVIEHDPDVCIPIDDDDPGRYMRPPKQFINGSYVDAYPSTVLSNVETPSCRRFSRENRDPNTGKSINSEHVFVSMAPFYDEKHRMPNLCEVYTGNANIEENALYLRRGYSTFTATNVFTPHYDFTYKWTVSAADTGRIIDPFTGAPFATKQVFDTPDSRTDSNSAMMTLAIVYHLVHNELCGEFRNEYPEATEDELYEKAYEKTALISQLHIKEGIEHLIGKNLFYHPFKYKPKQSSDLPTELGFTLRSHTIPPEHIAVFDAETHEVVETTNARTYYPNGTISSNDTVSYPLIFQQAGQGSEANGGGLAMIQQAGGVRNFVATGLIHPMSKFDLQVSGPLDFAFTSKPFVPGPFPDTGEFTTDIGVVVNSLLKSRENGVPALGQKYPDHINEHASCVTNSTSLECFEDVLDRESDHNRVVSMWTLYEDVNNIDLMLAAWANTPTLKAEWESVYDFLASSDRFWFERPRPNWSIFDIFKLKTKHGLCKTIDRHLDNLCTDLGGNPFTPRMDIFNSVNLTAKNIEAYNSMRVSSLTLGNPTPEYPGRFDVRSEALMPGDRVIMRG